jgi:nanoRNase/pAp phosphatase (c-di-AMP/oligoRNAs hydrolase)
MVQQEEVVQHFQRGGGGGSGASGATAESKFFALVQQELEDQEQIYHQYMEQPHLWI